jgi:hypothetical protein
MLIFKNGYVSWVQTSTQDLVDTNGNAIAVEGQMRKAECYIDVVQEDKRGELSDGHTQRSNGKYTQRSNGKYTQRSYKVLLDQSSVPAKFNPTSITLHHNRKGNIGTYTVQRIEFYDLTGSIEIWV